MKKFLSLMLVLALALGLCGGALADSSTHVFWYTFSDVYLSSVRAALGEALAAKNIAFVDNDANATQATQTDQISTAITSGASALVVNICESSVDGIAQNVVDMAKEAGIPLIFFNRSVSQEVVQSYDKCLFVGTNYEEAGIMQGQMIGKYVADNFDALDLNKDGVISYVMFKGDEANQEAIARTKYGVEDADKALVAAGKPALSFYDASNANKYLVDQNGTWSNQASFEYMQNILAQYNQENNNMAELIICNNDDMALGAVNALQNAGYNTAKDGALTIPVFGVDATATAKELIAAGYMTGTIKQDAVGMADAITTVVSNMTTGKPALEGLNANYVVVDGWKVAIPYGVYTGEE